MRLTAKDDPETIRRFAHIKPARGRRVVLCEAICPGTTRKCTLAAGHHGPHVAHGLLRKVHAVWDSGTELRASTAPLQRSLEARGPRLRDQGDPSTLLAALWARTVRALSNVEEVVFIILFIAFVFFGIDWFLRIVRGG